MSTRIPFILTGFKKFVLLVDLKYNGLLLLTQVSQLGILTNSIDVWETDDETSDKDIE